MNEKEKLIYEYLTELFPEAEIELKFKNAFELLVAVVLSAQCTDVRVNKVTPVLFDKYPSAKDMMAAKLEDIEKIIYSTGFYKNKAKNIKSLSEKIVTDHDGNVPKTVEGLGRLPGVGKKTANVVYSNYFGGDAIAVDTHVLRVSNRLGLSKSSNPNLVEKDLMRRFDKNIWSDLHSKMVLFGRYYCKSRNPKCDHCRLKDICIYYNKGDR